MVQLLLKGLDWLWNLRGLEGVRHRIFRYGGIAFAAYQVLAVDASSPFAALPDIPVLWFSAIMAWLSTKGIEFAKAHKP